MKTTIYIVRHGQSCANEAKVIAGHTDTDLTELGRKQAKLTAEALSSVHFDAMYSSDLKRAYNTGLPHAEMRDMSITPDLRFRELFMGDWENVSISAAQEGWRELYFGDWVNDFPAFRAPNGESVRELADRFYNGILDISRKNPGATLLVASHAGAIRAFWGRVLGEGEALVDVPFPTNASYSVVTCDGDKIYAEKYSCDGHLEGMITEWKN